MTCLLAGRASKSSRLRFCNFPGLLVYIGPLCVHVLDDKDPGHEADIAHAPAAAIKKYLLARTPATPEKEQPTSRQRVRKVVMPLAELSRVPPTVSRIISFTPLIRGSSIVSRYRGTTSPSTLGWNCSVLPPGA